MENKQTGGSSLRHGDAMVSVLCTFSTDFYMEITKNDPHHYSNSTQKDAFHILGLRTIYQAFFILGTKSAGKTGFNQVPECETKKSYNPQRGNTHQIMNFAYPSLTHLRQFIEYFPQFQSRQRVIKDGVFLCSNISWKARVIPVSLPQASVSIGRDV